MLAPNRLKIRTSNLARMFLGAVRIWSLEYFLEKEAWPGSLDPEIFKITWQRYTLSWAFLVNKETTYLLIYLLKRHPSCYCKQIGPVRKLWTIILSLISYCYMNFGEFSMTRIRLYVSKQVRIIFTIDVPGSIWLWF